MFRQTKEKDEKGGDTRLLLILPAFRERGTNLTEYRSFVMQLADKKIRIKPLYDMIREYCKEYIIPDSYANPEDINSCGNYGKNKSFPVNLDVQITPQDIDYERMRSDRQAEMTGEKMAAYSEAYLETLAVYRKIAEWMPMLLDNLKQLTDKTVLFVSHRLQALEICSKQLHFEEGMVQMKNKTE